MMGVPIKGLICFCLEWQDAKWAVHAQNDMTAILEKKGGQISRLKLITGYFKLEGLIAAVCQCVQSNHNQ